MWGKRVLVTITAVSCIGLLASSAVFAKKTLKFWVPSGYTWKQMETKFEKENKNVDIQIVSGGLDKFYTMITAGLMPDIWGPWDTPGITADVNRNWALDLGPFIKRDGKAMKIDDFFPGLMRQFRVRGRQYSLPIFSYADWYFYNTDLYAQAGLQPPPLNAKDKSWNWDKMILNAQKTTKIGANGRFTQAGLEFSRDFSCTPNWVHLWGVPLYSKEALQTSIPQNVNLDGPEMQNALTKMWELIHKYRVVSPGSMGFSGGKVAGSIEHGWNVKYIMLVKKLKWAIAPLPWAVTNSGTLWPDGWRISRICKDKELAWKFVKFLCAPENMRLIISDPKGQYPGTAVARKSVFEETLGRDISRVTGMKPGDVFRVQEQMDDVGIVKESETICLHTDLSTQYIEPILTQVWSNKLSPRQGTAKLQEAVNKAMPVLFKRWMRNVKYTGVDITK